MKAGYDELKTLVNKFLMLNFDDIHLLFTSLI